MVPIIRNAILSYRAIAFVQFEPSMCRRYATGAASMIARGEFLSNTISMHRFRHAIVSLLAVTLQVLSLTSATMGECMHSTSSHQRHAAQPATMPMNMPAACHQQHQQDPCKQHSSQGCQSLCAAYCASSMAVLADLFPAVFNVVDHDQVIAPEGRLSSTVTPSLFRPPIATPMFSPWLTA